MRRSASRLVLLIAVVVCPVSLALSAQSPPTVPVGQFIAAIGSHAAALQNSSGMKRGFDVFTAEFKLPPGSVRYSDYVIARLVYEGARAGGFWGTHWAVTNKPPESDLIWHQWSTIRAPSYTKQTATAECDELSALYAFLVERQGVRSVGLYYPYPNHTVAVWEFHRTPDSMVRVVVPTTLIFLTNADDFGTQSFNPWTQKHIYEYTRRDVPDSFEIPRPLFEFFVAQMDKYGGATNDALQKIHAMRAAVFEGSWTPEQAARAALAASVAASPESPEDSAAYKYFVADMRSSESTNGTESPRTPKSH